MKQLTIPSIFTAVDKFSAPVTRMQSTVAAFGTKTEAAMARAERSSRKFAAVTDSIQNKFFNLQNAAIGLAAAMVIKSGFTMVEQMAERGDDIAKTASQIGITTKSLQELEFAAMRENVSAETLRGSLTKMNKAVGELQRGQGDLYSSLKKTDPVLLSQLQKVTKSEDAFLLLSEAVMKAPNAMQKAAIATKAFGRSGQEMLKLLEIGPEGIRKLADEANKLGVVMDDKMIKQAAQFADASDNMKQAMFGAKLAIGSGLLPVFNDLVTKTTDYIVANRDLIAQKAEAIFDRVSSAIKFLADNGEIILKVMAGLIILFTVMKVVTFALQAATFLYNAAVIGASVAQWVWNAALIAGSVAMMLLTTPVLIIIGLITTIILLFMSFRRNWDMVIKAFKTDGILAGLKAIGATLLDTVLWPLQKILEIVGRLPGKMGALARSGAASIENFRGNLGIDTGEGAATAPAGNPKAAQTEALNSTIEKNTNKNVTLDFKNMPAGVQAYGDGLNNSFMPQLGSTLAF